MADEKRAGEILGLGDTPVPTNDADDEVRAIAPERDQSSEEPRRRRADDIAERDAAPRDPVGGPEPPPGLHVEN
jgi:hypothetical protein